MRYGRPDPEWELPHLSDAHVRLRNLPLSEGDVFDYVYDFGDHRQADILLEGVLPIEAAEDSPRCLAGERAFPHEDAGGVGGYELLCEALADPGHDEHDQYRTWAGDWEPEGFDLEQVNQRLARLG
ncbi:MAG: plasmid pRiA4b ORF-3 family protein [Thermoleophilia bacterium]